MFSPRPVTLLSLSLLLSACVLDTVRSDAVSNCQQRCNSACSHYWLARDLSCQTACSAVCAPTAGVASPCVPLTGAQEGGSSEGVVRGASSHAACWRLCSTGCRDVLDRDVCRNTCLRFTDPQSQ